MVAKFKFVDLKDSQKLTLSKRLTNTGAICFSSSAKAAVLPVAIIKSGANSAIVSKFGSFKEPISVIFSGNAPKYAGRFF